MTQESEALKRTLIAGAKVGAIIIVCVAAFFGVITGFTALFDSMGFRPGNSVMLAMAIAWCMVAAGGALKWKYDQILKEIRERDVKIMKGLKG